MSKLREAAQAALVELTNCADGNRFGHRCSRCDSEIDPDGNIASALRAALAEPDEKQEPTPVAVKPLAWTEDSDGQWTDADCGFWITRTEDPEPGEEWSAAWGEGDTETFPTLEAAKAACQIQLERWIRKMVVAGAPPAAEKQEPVIVEAVAEVVSTEDGLQLEWLVEGGIAAMERGDVLMVCGSASLTGDDGSGEVYLAAPPAREPLTEEQRDKLLLLHFGLPREFVAEPEYLAAVELVRSVERAQGIGAAAIAKEAK